RFYSIVQYLLHRPAAADPVSPRETQELYTKRYNLMLSPADLEGSQVLTYRYDQATRLSDKWLYYATAGGLLGMPSPRRVAMQERYDGEEISGGIQGRGTPTVTELTQEGQGGGAHRLSCPDSAPS